VARQHRGLLDDLFEIGRALPPWVAMILAIVAFGLLHTLASQPLATPTAPGAVGTLAAQTFYISLASVGQWVLPFALLMGALVSAIQRRKRAGLHAKTVECGLSSIDGMSWREFESLVGEAFRKRGYSVVETGGGGADGGVDLVLAKGRETFLVQCKHWRASSVGVKIVRELYGVMAARGATGGFVVTAGRFSSDAWAFAKGRNIELVDGQEMAALIGNASPRERTNAITRPRPPTERKLSGNADIAGICPRCGSPMVKRVAKKGKNAGEPFWGCSAFPQCRVIRPVEQI
jgi:restriction system protein